MFVAVRASLTNLDHVRASDWPIQFDSQRPHAYLRSTPVSCATKVEVERLTRMARVLRSTLELGLFGFDVIQCETTQRYYVVDVNYFPSYKELGSDVPHLIRDYCLASRSSHNIGRTEQDAWNPSASVSTNVGQTRVVGAPAPVAAAAAAQDLAD